ncbi:hypothetical protein [Pararobbsia alpina]|uniref:Uncharacterized protein n=1 Tax=Pararobbsia alpina TaxID=621374 RepID=A0A6S7CPI7_9BURK|nr:hypothetical protein [Pararobbsia alpina]CAB3784649.1 hypothetical protein LMG28138_01851 [Pararobbsia alpina]
MNAKELAQKLNGSQYPFEVGSVIRAEAKAAGLVIVYGASDDLMEFDGAIRDELGAYEGTTAHLDSTGLLENGCDNDECPHFEKLKAKAATIEAVWDDGTYSWTYQTAIPHETFEVLEGDEKYCRGIVFALADVVAA